MRGFQSCFYLTLYISQKNINDVPNLTEIPRSPSFIDNILVKIEFYINQNVPLYSDLCRETMLDWHFSKL